MGFVPKQGAYRIAMTLHNLRCWIERLLGRSLSARFVIAGIANTSFSTLLFMLLLWLGLSIAAGNALSLVAGVLFSYQMHGSLVFRSRSRAAFVRYIALWFVMYFVNLFEIKLLMMAGWGQYAAVALAAMPTTVVSYFAQKFLVFRVSNNQINRDGE